MNKWKRDGDGRVPETLSILELNKGLDEAIAAFNALPDESPWYQEHLQDLEISRSIRVGSCLAFATHATN